MTSLKERAGGEVLQKGIFVQDSVKTRFLFEMMSGISGGWFRVTSFFLETGNHQGQYNFLCWEHQILSES
jgi:hypothetical protein